MTSLLLLLATLPAADPLTIAYGADAERNLIDIYQPDRSTPGTRPLLLFVHGGAWMIGDRSGVHNKTAFTGDGYVVASCNYRLVPSVTVRTQAEDVAAAIDYLLDHADDYTIDPARVVLMGHSAGAHLAALVATDPAYLAKHDRNPGDLAGLVLLDGGTYDVSKRVDPASGRSARIVTKAFGTDAAELTALSPTRYARQHGAPASLIIHIEGRGVSREQSTELVDTIRAAGGTARLYEAAGKTHRSLNVDLGKPGDDPTEQVRAFLAAIALRK